MYSPLQSLYIKGHAGEALPPVWDALERKGTRFRRGQLGLICAGPGVGKSAFILSYALRAMVPTMYFSADSDAYTQLSRSLSILTGQPLETSTRMVLDEDLGETKDVFADIPIRFNYSASPTLDQVELSMRSYEEVYGSYPALVIVDNITNVRHSTVDDDPFSGLESLMDYLHDMARSTGAFVVGLHHVTGPFNDADKPIPLSGVKGQIARVPEIVLTLHKEVDDFGPDLLNVSTVKNRGGKADPSGSDFVSLEFVGDSMQIRDPK